jgi:hypothetical protein
MIFQTNALGILQEDYWYIWHIFFFICAVGLWHCGHYWPIVPALGDRWWWLRRNWWNKNWQGKPKYSEKTCPRSTLSTTNPTWIWTRAAAVGSQRLTAWAMARPSFELGPRHLIYWLIFIMFSSVSLTVNVGRVPRLGHDRFLYNPFRLVFHRSSNHWTFYNTRHNRT